MRVRALNGAAWLAIDQGDYPDADRLLSESTELSRRLNDKAGEGMAAVFGCRSMISSDRIAEAAPYAERAFALLTEADDRPGIAFALFFLALNAQFTGNLEAACELHERCVALCRELGFESLGARALQPLGIARLELGDLTGARTALQQGLPASVAVGDRFIIPIGLSGFAGLAAKTGKHRMALRLAGAAEAYRDTYESALPEPVRAYLDSWLAPALKTVGAAAARLIAEGRQMTLTAALEYALADEPEEAWRPGPRQALTRRETEVAMLAARGLTNRDIAARLYLSVRTVEVHIDHILTKLGFRTRTQLAAWAHEEGPLAGKYVVRYVILQMTTAGAEAQRWRHERHAGHPAAARPDCQVLVVGAGPTGLVLAADLLARGVSTRIIDKGDGVNLETRAIAIHARALEVLDLMGLADRFVDHGQVVRWFSFYADGKPRLSLDLARNGTRFPFMLDIPQHQTEALLRARVAELGGVIEQRTELTGLSDEPAGVTARVRDADGQPRVITAGYVVGCDGAHSRVRHELGLRIPRSPVPAGLAAGRRPAGLGPPGERSARLLPGRRHAADLLPDARAPVAAGGALRR